MRRKLTTTTTVLLLLLVMAGAPAGADASSKGQGHTDLSSLPKIEAYLGSIGIDLGSVVVQHGRLNYAGPNCPGAGWNCTTANKVVQLAPATLPAANIVDCSPTVSITLLGVDECVIVQSSALSLTETATTMNSASCDIQGASADTKQRCKIRQQSKKGNNHAQINQRTTQHGGSPQSAAQEASVEQTSESGNNTAKITQTIQQTLDTHQTGAVTQSQNARQYASVSQSSTSGKNSSDVQQYQDQSEDADSDGDVTQEQNTDSSLSWNVEASVTQTSTLSGNITSDLRQLINQYQEADSPAGTVTQREGNGAGGLRGTVIQAINSPGVIGSTSTQDEDQTQDASTSGDLTQTKIGPEFCCATQNGGTTANVNTVTQSSVQTDNEALGSTQTSEQIGHCSETFPGAECTLTQTYTANGETNSTGPMTGMTVSNTRTCSGGVEGVGCFGP